ncbi:permease prefix domain 1-containing protein [Pseudonocardia sp. GCM10023141]|uniref:permease prefix domain 1-containing protein n=1 Tax=Pseudonocardia sp. GCM10023141 TaxID=3252653 RepID=UPI0036060BCE
MAGHDVAGRQIETYLTAVSAGLVGPPAACTAILDELRDGLHEATRCRRERGVSSEAAVAAALREFGPPAVVAASFTGELATGRARRVIAAYLLTGPIVGSAWLLMLAPAQWRQGAATMSVASLWAAVPVAPAIGIAVGVGLVVLVATRRPHRRLGQLVGHGLPGAMIVIGSAVLGDLVMIIAATCSTTVLANSPTLAILAVSVSAARLCCAQTAGARCLRSWRSLGDQ